MKSNFTNKVNVEGYIFSIEDNRGYNKLAKREAGVNSKNPGVEYISGVINVATDAEALNVVPVHFTYVTATTKAGKPNSTFEFLSDIVEADEQGVLATYQNSGINAMRVRIDGSIDVNDWINREGEMTASRRVRGSFAHPVDSVASFNPHANFDVDMLITQAALREVEDGDDYMSLNGYVFDFRNNILPLGLTIDIPEGIAYFEGQGISQANPMLTNVWGEINTAVVGTDKVIESAFGAPRVETTSRSFTRWNVLKSAVEPMAFDDDLTITQNELNKLLQEREVRVQQEKARQEERRNNRGNITGFGSGVKSASPTADADFAF